MYFHHHMLWFILRLRYFSTISTFLTHWSSSAHLSIPFSFDLNLCLFVFALLYFLHLHFPDQYINTFLLTCYFYLMLLHLQTRDNVTNRLNLFFSYSWWLILFLSTQACPDSFRLSPSTLEKFPFSFYYYSLLLHRWKTSSFIAKRYWQYHLYVVFTFTLFLHSALITYFFHC